jgi:hypothetical protein
LANPSTLLSYRVSIFAIDSTTSSNQDNTIKSINNGDSKPVKNNELLSKEASVQTFHWLLEHYTLRTSNRLTQHAEKGLLNCAYSAIFAHGNNGI